MAGRQKTWSYEAFGPPEVENDTSSLLSPAESLGEQMQQDTDHFVKASPVTKEFGNMCQIFKK